MKILSKIILTILITLLVIPLAIRLSIKKTTDYGNEPFYDSDGVLYHDLSKDNLYGKELFFYDDENYTSSLGIDISVYQRNIDFEVLKKSGIDFIYLRLGYRGYESGLLFKDNAFENLYKKAKDAGFKIGVYFFSSAINSQEIEEEVAFVVKHLQNKEIDLPVALDLEEIDDEVSRINELTDEGRMENIHQFFECIEKTGYEGILYTNKAYIKEHLNQKEISSYPLWLAQYTAFPDYEYPFSIWQYTCTGEIQGIDYPLDLNLMITAKK